MDLCVAGLPIRVESADKGYFSERFAEYVCEDGRKPVMVMCTCVLDAVTLPEGEPVQRIKNVQIVRMADGRLCRYVQGRYPDGRLGPVLFAIYYTSDYTQVDIELFAHRRHPTLSTRDFEYIFTGASFQNCLAYRGGGVLHSSSLAWNGQGVAFSAPSGTGKSTHVGLWKETFGDAVEIINDDKPAIYFDGEQAMLCGTPWSGKTALNCNRAVPLRAIVFVERGETNHIRRLDTVDSMLRLTGQIARPYYDENLGVKLVDFTEKIYKHIPIYCLTCDVSRQAVETAFNAIFPQEAL